MKLTILGGCGAWPTSRQACGGYLLEHDGFTVLIDPGYAVLPRLLGLRPAADIDAVLISHGHLDHCADLNPLLRARVLGRTDCAPLPVYAPARALDRVFAAECIRTVARGAEVSTIADGDSLALGPFVVDVTMLPHQLPNAGMRIAAAEHVLAYTGDSGDCVDRIALAKGADVLLAEATYVAEIPAAEAPYLSSARQVARLALASDAQTTILTHQWPGDPAEHALAAVRSEGLDRARVAFAGMVVDLSEPTGAPLAPPSPGRSRPWARRAAPGVARQREVAAPPRRAAR